MGLFVGCVAGVLSLWVIYQSVNTEFIAVLRLVTLCAVCVWWQQCIEMLISIRLVHPFHRPTAIAFRWRFFALVVMVELFVIQQLPSYVMDVFRA